MQRLLAFVSRIHNFCLLVLAFFLLAYLACGFFAVSEQFVDLLILCVHVICWTIYLLSVWIFSLVIISWVNTRLFPSGFFFFMLLRTAVAFGISLLVALMEHLVRHGIVVSF